MASENQWAYDLEGTVVALVKAKGLPQLKSQYPKIKITDEESASTGAVFPTAYIHMIGSIEKGKTLDGQSINSVNATFQMDVTANKKADCKKDCKKACVKEACKDGKKADCKKAHNCKK